MAVCVFSVAPQVGVGAVESPGRVLAVPSLPPLQLMLNPPVMEVESGGQVDRCSGLGQSNGYEVCTSIGVSDHHGDVPADSLWPLCFASLHA